MRRRSGRIIGRMIGVLRWLLWALATTTAGGMSTASARAETAQQVCTRAGTDDTLRPIPEDLVPTVNALFHTTMPTDAAVAGTVFRCMGRRVLVCTTGANLPCGKADTKRTSVGAVHWCHEHPDASSIPAYAIGHDTIFTWRCRDGAPVIVSQTYQLDARGFVAQYWLTIP